MSEVDANRRLNTLRRKNNWDPNMPDSAFDAIDEATEAHDQKGETQLVGEIIENSPYPEVSFVIAHVYIQPLRQILRSALLFATTMRTCPATPFELGSSVCS